MGVQFQLQRRHHHIADNHIAHSWVATKDSSSCGVEPARAYEMSYLCCRREAEKYTSPDLVEPRRSWVPDVRHWALYISERTSVLLCFDCGCVPILPCWLKVMCLCTWRWHVGGGDNCVNLTEPRCSWEEAISVEIALSWESSIRLTCREVCGRFSWLLIDWCGWAQFTVGGAVPGGFVLGGIRKQNEQTMERKPVRSLPPWPPSCLPQGSYPEFLLWLP